MQTIKVKFADREYEIKKLKIKANREWRKKFEEPINRLLSATKAIGELAAKRYEKTSDMVKDIGVVLLLHSDSIIRVLIESVDIITDAVFAYSPELIKAKTWIEENGDDEEMVQAFLDVVKLAYPFTGVFQAMTKLGQMAEQTSQNSPSVNGESGKTN